MMLTLLSALALTLSPNDPAPEATPPQAIAIAIKAKTIWLGDGRAVEDGVVLISDGKIQRVGRGVDIPQSASVIEHDGVLTAGMIALHTYTGAENEVNESTRAVTADCDLVHAFNPAHKDFAKAREAGITTVVLTPPATNLAGGVTCVVKTAGKDPLERRAHLALSMCTESLLTNRYPTSYTSATAELDARFEEGKGAFGEAKAGQLTSLIDVRSRADVQRALGLAKRHRLKGALHGADLAGELAEEIKASGMAVVHAPLNTNTTGRTLKAMVALAEAGIPFGFGMDAPQNDVRGLRQSAAMCVRAGVEPSTAWKALTADAAKIAGVDARVGSLAQGKDADIVLWSGNPLDLGSSIEAVYVDGKMVHGGDQ